ncbi:MAG: hypothetical protein KKD00_04620 [Gammaproteobacteria bacterium]|nr:hypothetical protein [Gammaproteobacteria bacterium]
MGKLILRVVLNACLSLFAAGNLTAQQTDDSVVVVVSSSQLIDALNVQQVEDIFLGRHYAFPDGSQAIPVDHPENSEVWLKFYQDILGHSAAQIRSHWARQVFTGRGRPPQKAASADELLQMMRDDIRIISYLKKTSLTADTKVVLE